MRYTTKTEYAILCMTYLAKKGADTYVTAREIASQANYPLAFVEKIFQALKHGGLVKSLMGQQGGYTLQAPAHQITLRQIIESIEGTTFESFCEPQVRQDIACAGFCLCGVKPIWRQTKHLLDDFFSSITLDVLTQNELAVSKKIGAL